MLEIRLLGQFDLRLDGVPIPLPSRAAQRLLAYLSLSPGVAHRREKLAGLLWPEVEDAVARRNLRQVLWRLRKALEPSDLILADEFSLTFNLKAEHWLDVTALLQPAEALTTTLALYTGELLPGFHEAWVIAERERVQASFDQQMHRLLDQLLAAQRWPLIVEWAEHWIARSHAPEPAYRALMTAQANRGDIARASDTYQRCLAALNRDFGVDPSPETRAVYQHLLSRSAPAPAPRPRHNLPAPLTSFIGREAALAELKHGLTNTRLLTLSGAGGTGKTRLALQAATQARDAELFPDGVWLIELAPLTDPARLPQAVAAGMEVHEQPGRPLIESITEHLGHQRVLVLLDNCEHLVEASAHLAEALLRRCPGLTLLVTSRERLGVTGETVFPVPSLTLPDTTWDLPELSELLHFEALQLFCDRARSALPAFALTAQNRGDVTRICRQLDGLPLAIELAAAWAGVLQPAEIAARLDDALRLLRADHRPARHQTLRAALDWSYDLLPAAEQATLRQLAVFQGSWTLDAAEAVCGGDVLARVAALVHKSLVTADHVPATQTRYQLLEMIRQYAHEKLSGADEAAPAHQRHLDYYLAWAERAERYGRGPNQAVWLEALEAERHNLRAALSWAIASNSPESLRLAGALGGLWYVRALAQPALAPLPLTRAKTLYAAGLLAAAQGHHAHAQALLEESAALFEAAGERAAAAQSRAALGQ